MERLKALEIFKAVADHGSFTKAAEVTNVGVPAVSRAVQDLEALLGVQLFHRTTRKVTLTPVGHTVLEHAAGVLDCYDGLARVSHDIALEVSGDIRFEVPVLFGMGRLAPILANFMREYPKVRVDTRFVDNSGETLGDLADLSIVVGRSVPSSWVARPLGATRFGIYASPGFISSAGMPKHPSEVRSTHCMAVVVGSRDASWQLSHCATGEQSAISAQSPFRTNCPSALVAAAVDGTGVAILPEHIGCIPESRGELVRILSDWRAPSFDTQLLYRVRRHQPLRVRKLVDRLVSGFSESAIPQVESLAAHSLSSFAQFRRSGADARDSLMAA